MSMIVVGSVRSSGATTLALTMAGWLDRVALVEADADGGVLALRFGLSREPGLVTLAAARDFDSRTLSAHTQILGGRLPVVVAPESPERASYLIRTAGTRLASGLARLDDTDVIVDIGRIGPSSPALCFTGPASTVLVVARPRAEELVAAAERVRALGSAGGDVGLVLCGRGPYMSGDVTSQLGCPVFGTIPDDPRAAGALVEGGTSKALARSALARGARTLVRILTERRALSAPPQRTSGIEPSEVPT